MFRKPQKHLIKLLAHCVDFPKQELFLDITSGLIAGPKYFYFYVFKLSYRIVALIVMLYAFSL